MQRQYFAVFTAVVAAHAGALWLLQQGLQGKQRDETIAAEVLMEWVMPSPSQAPSPPPAVVSTPKATSAQPHSTSLPRAHQQAQQLTPPVVAPVAVEPLEAPLAQATPPATTSASAPSALAASASLDASAQLAASAAPKIELPSTQADYLNNPRPPYPPLSKRLGEQGRVVLRVRIETDGTASQAEIQRSSGFERLDQTALKTVLRWRFVPGKRNGAPEAMWFNIPIHFVLE